MAILSVGFFCSNNSSSHAEISLVCRNFAKRRLICPLYVFMGNATYRKCVFILFSGLLFCYGQQTRANLEP